MDQHAKCVSQRSFCSNVIVETITHSHTHTHTHTQLIALPRPRKCSVKTTRARQWQSGVDLSHRRSCIGCRYASQCVVITAEVSHSQPTGTCSL